MVVMVQIPGEVYLKPVPFALIEQWELPDAVKVKVALELPSLTAGTTYGVGYVTESV